MSWVATATGLVTAITSVYKLVTGLGSFVKDLLYRRKHDKIDNASDASDITNLL